MKAGDFKIEIKVSKIVFYFNLIFSIFFAIIFLFLIIGDAITNVGHNIVTILAATGFVIGLFFRTFYIQSQRIYITNMDVRYQCWFQRKAIKTVESFNATGIWIFNSVVFTGRGYSRIKMSNVENFDKIRELVESVDHLKAKN